MDALIILGIVAAIAFVHLAKQSKGTNGMNDTPVSIDNIRKGVANGWYKATLLYHDGEPAILLKGKMTDGKTYSDIYPISQADWDTLKAEGYDVQL